MDRTWFEKVRRRTVNEASLGAERIYKAIVKQKRESETGILSEDLIFDPMRPKTHDWEKVLSSFAEKVIKKRKASKPRTSITFPETKKTARSLDGYLFCARFRAVTGNTELTFSSVMIVQRKANKKTGRCRPVR